MKVSKQLCWDLLAIYVFLFKKCFKDIKEVRMVFYKIVIDGKITIKGEIEEMKLEFGQNIAIEAKPKGGDYQHGSAQFSVQAASADGTDVSGDFTVEVSPDNELKAKIVRAPGLTTECSGVVTLRADGDPDADEEAPIVGTLAFNYDSPNATGFDLVGTVAEETPAPVV